MSTVAVVGGHGQVALALTRRLSQRGDDVISLVRNPDHEDDVEQAGGRMAVVDLEQDDDAALADAIRGADAVVFAAGAGPGSGAERKRTVDRDGAIRVARAAEEAGVRRYLMISAMGVDDAPASPDDDEVFEVYLRAKADADRAIMDSDLAWTVLRPGGLTDDDGTGRVTAGRALDRGEIPRDDVAAALVAALDDDATVGAVIELVAGDTPVAEALHDAAG